MATTIKDTDAPTLAAAGVSPDAVEARMAPPPKAAEPEVPAHHVQAAWEALMSGNSLETSCNLAGVPHHLVEALALEIDGCAKKLGVPAPAHCKAHAEREAEKNKVVEEPKGEEIKVK